MSIRQQPRRTARILSLLTLSQFRAKSEQLEDIEINDLIFSHYLSIFYIVIYLTTNLNYNI